MATSTISQLRESLRSIEERLAELVAISPVKWFDRDTGFLRIAGGADYYFQSPRPEQVRLQLSLKGDYGAWVERFLLLYRNPPSGLREQIDKANKSLANWIDLGGSNYEIGSNQQANAVVSRSACRPFYDLLDMLEGKGEVIIVPDTNALIASPDPKNYKAIAGTDSFTFLLVPTVLAELDNLKNFARDPDFREKVNRVVRRIKGWRDQARQNSNGSLSAGVTLYRTIRVRAIAQEPDVRGTLGWLDPSNRDDRIIASAIGVQVMVPTAHVILVTGDINLQNKAEAARLPYGETP